jgi:23S rRNA-/tRNA-specific pseudouridylate synthase
LPKELQDRVKRMPFQLLHALCLRFKHPVKEKTLSLTAPLRPEMVKFQEDLKRAFL